MGCWIFRHVHFAKNYQAVFLRFAHFSICIVYSNSSLLEVALRSLHICLHHLKKRHKQIVKMNAGFKGNEEKIKADFNQQMSFHIFRTAPGERTLAFSLGHGHFPYLQHIIFLLKLLVHFWLCLIKGNLA